MAVKGRASRNGPRQPARGERNNGAKLREMDVVRIRDYFKKGMTVKELANRYRLTDTSIRNIVNNKTWTHIER